MSKKKNPNSYTMTDMRRAANKLVELYLELGDFEEMCIYEKDMNVLKDAFGVYDPDLRAHVYLEFQKNLTESRIPLLNVMTPVEEVENDS